MSEHLSAILGFFILLWVTFLGIFIGKNFMRSVRFGTVQNPVYEVRQIDQTLYVETNLMVEVNGRRVQ